MEIFIATGLGILAAYVAVESGLALLVRFGVLVDDSYGREVL